MKRPAVLPLVLLLAGAGALACRDAEAPAPRPGFRFLERPRATGGDTVGVELPGRLVVVLYDSAGKPRADAEVGVLAVTPPGGSSFDPALEFRPADRPDAPWSDVWQTRTDSLGRASFAVKLGTVAGQMVAALYWNGRRLDQSDTVQFAVLPGAAARVEMLPKDTALYVGRSYQLRMRVLDAHGNVRGDPVAVRSDSSAVAVAAGGAVRGERIGRALVRATAGRAADSAWASVVPAGTLAATRIAAGMSDHLAQLNLDGSELRVVVPRPVHTVAFASSGGWMAIVDGSEGRYGNGRIFVRDAQGAERPLLPDYDDYNETQQGPRSSADDRWIYFAGRTTYHTSILRVHPDGSGLDTVAAPQAGTGSAFRDPAPSPDGRMVAFLGGTSCATACSAAGGIQVRDLGTGATIAAGLPGEQPRWIPGTDTLVVSTPAGFIVMRPNGAVVRRIAFPLSGFSPFDLSPDGRWIAVATDAVPPMGWRQVVLLSLDGKLRLPLAFTGGVVAPIWHP
ncbi:MAG TPA: hypothetical protein VKA84_03585 [Gemmatimonadaceae bacterium]|nr:hypothetical protein [Gemmatimonadaceae bacterium]